MNQEQKNPFDYSYTGNQTVEVPANFLLNVAFFCEKVIESQPKMGVAYAYPADVKSKTDENGNLTFLNIDWKSFTPGDMPAFFQQVEKPIPFATELSLLAEQVFHSVITKHMENIEAGIAKKNGELTKEVADEDVASILSKPDTKKN